MRWFGYEQVCSSFVNLINSSDYILKELGTLHGSNGLISVLIPGQGYKWKPKARFPAFEGPSTGTDPCTPWYPGHRAFESHEVNNIANYITTLPNLKAYIDLRSYGQMSKLLDH